MLEVNNLSVSISDRYLVKNLSFVLNSKDKMAIIGEEGNGKSTLLKAILGICKYAKIDGNINFKDSRIGYLEQSISDIYLNKTVYNYLFKDDNGYY